MNAHSILSAQGWRGHGHSLHKTDDSIGLSKPLLLNRKNNTKGLGTSSHFNADQWWLNAFDEQLKGLETGKKGVKQTVTTGKLNTVKNGSLGKYSVYTSFVSGGFLQGTVDMLNKLSSDSSSGTSSSDEDSDKNKKKSKSKGKGEKKTKETKETKEERKVRKAARKERKDARAVRRAARQVRREKKAAKKKSSSSCDSSDASKEEKRQRRAKKEEKRRKRKAEEDS